jgi:hypothetical protein
MSIFKDTFIPEVQGQLKTRQDAIFNRTPATTHYLNARNAWIRMTSSVEVEGDNGALANKYVLLGGTLDSNKKLREGVGGGEQKYSLTSPGGTPHRLGIRLMPGITSIEIKSKSAYGSLREVTVNFVCWDITQLEELELLYMRPGYTVLVEWGWLPYLNNENQLQSNVDFYNSVLNADKKKEEIWKDLFTKSKELDGNYDAMFGYVKNYSWSARNDGGYDCTTTIITLGEILESLKVNYVSYDNPTVASQGVGLAKGLDISLDSENTSKAYSKNILAGLFYEMYEIGKAKTKSSFTNNTQDNGKGFIFKDSKYNNYYDLFHKTINIKGGENEEMFNGEIGESDEQIYISLEGLVNLLNNYVLLQDTDGKTPFVKLSVHERQYDKENPVTPNPITGDGYLKALAHPLQLSVDPTVCIIKNKLWADGGIKFNVSGSNIDPNTGESTVRYSNTDYTDVIKKVNDELANFNSDEKKIIDIVVNATKRNTNEFKELQKQYLASKDKKFNNVSDWLDSALDTQELNLVLVGKEYNRTAEDGQLYTVNKDAITLSNAEADAKQLERTKDQLNRSNTDAVENLEFLKNISRPYYINDDYSSELGVIGNIFINLNMLYNLATDQNLASQDKNEKNDIVLYDYLKSVLSKISFAIGSVNNFDLHVDPIDNNIARIIDINFVDQQNQQDIYNNSFELQIQNTKSIVRSYDLQSQIFPDQSTTVAISAQTGGGALGMDTSTLVDFNKSIRDRIIAVKTSPLNDPAYNNSNNALNVIIQSLNVLYKYFSQLNFNWVADADFDVDKANDYKNALKDLINIIRTISFSKTKNKAIIPTKLSLTLDGIGGLVIGHIFKVPEDVLPKGYRGNGIGSKLGYIVTSIGHSVGNNDWVTKIGAQTIILDDPSGPTMDFTNVTLEINPMTNTTTVAGTTATTNQGFSNSGIGSVAENSTKYPVLLKFFAFKTSYNATVQKFAKVSQGKVPVADSLRKLLDKNYIVEKGSELSSNGDITEDLKNAVIALQNKVKSNKAGFGFINANKPITLTAGNDTYHRTYGDKANRTTHSRGLAIDIRTTGFKDAEVKAIMSALKESGFVYVIYHGGTALHIHANIKTT